MDDIEAVLVLAALAQPTRLEAFRQLVEREPHGLAAGELARLLAVPQNTLSAHLSVLARAGLVAGERNARSIVYRPNLERIQGLTLHLLQDCCGGRPDLCSSVVDTLTPCCTPGTENAC
jgi:ArsR family transcriptional regulator